jgi:O-antigen ligase
MTEQPYYQEDTELSYDWQSDEMEYSKLKKCIGIVIAASFLSVLIYFGSGNKIFAGVPLVLVIGGLCLFNTNFGFMVLFFVPILEEWFVLVRGESVGGGLSLSKVIGIVIVISYVLTRLGKGVKFSGPLKLIFVIVALMGLSSVWSPYPAYTFIRTTTYALYACLAWMFFNAVEGNKCLNLMLWSLFGGNILIALLLATGEGIRSAGYYVGGAMATTSGEEGRLMFSEEGVGANVIAVFLVFAVLLGFYLFMKSGLFLKVCIVFAELPLLYVLVMTESRTGLIYVVIVPLATYVLASRKGDMLKTFLGVMLLLIIASGLYYAVMKTDILGANAKERMASSSENVTLTGRTVIWQRGKDLFLHRPLQGYGWGLFPIECSEGGMGLSAHSNIVMVAVELGMAGLILFGVLFFKLLFSCLKIRDYPTKWLGIMLLMWLFITGLGMTSMLTRVWWYLLAVIIRLVFLESAGFGDNLITEDDYNSFESVDGLSPDSGN